MRSPHRRGSEPILWMGSFEFPKLSFGNVVWDACEPFPRMGSFEFPSQRLGNMVLDVLINTLLGDIRVQNCCREPLLPDECEPIRKMGSYELADRRAANIVLVLGFDLLPGNG